MPLARENASPMRCAAKRNTTILHKRAMLSVAARQLQSLSTIERLQHEQQQQMRLASSSSSMDRKRRRCEHDSGEQSKAHDKKRLTMTITLSDELCELTKSVHHVQHQVATAARHIQELRALVHGYVAQRQEQTRTFVQAICA